jgi:rhamnose transport system ATP-binding protein
VRHSRPETPPTDLIYPSFVGGLSVEVLLRLDNIRKSFAGVHALKAVSFELRAGEVHALVGENGAGKSTLIKVVSGAHQADEGTLSIAGRVVEQNDPVHARGLGVAVIYQRPALLPDLTVAENIAIGLEKRGAARFIRWRARRNQAKELLARVGASIDPDAFVHSLSMPEQQLVEIARALGANARILVLDEPTASLSDREVERLLDVIRELRQQRVGIIYISHRLEELFQVADRVTVLRDGASVGTRAMHDVDRGELIRLMVGREITAIFPKQAVPIGDTVLRLEGVGYRQSNVRDVSFEVRAGETVGLAGLVGSGRTELARVLFGLTPADAGVIQWRGKQTAIRTPAQAAKLGIAYVPEDRRRHGVILEMPVTTNVTLAVLDRIASFGWIIFQRERALASDYVKRLAIKTPSLDTPVGDLSGGNQQKVAVARWLATEPKLLILDEPTQGIDVGAKAEIHRLMGELAGRGMAIVMISSELPEILRMSDRIVVMHSGTVSGILNRSEATQERVMAYALGLVADFQS